MSTGYFQFRIVRVLAWVVVWFVTVMAIKALGFY
jgi:hypothetical protein